MLNNALSTEQLSRAIVIA